jgi:hypothetical protein
MLRRFIAIICLSLAAVIHSGNIMAQTKTPQTQSDLGKIPVSEKELQLVFFAGLMGVFIVMVGLLFRRYRGEKASARAGRLRAMVCILTPPLPQRSFHRSLLPRFSSPKTTMSYAFSLLIHCD